MKRMLHALGAALLLASPASAEEGMWTFEHFPAARMQSALGWAPDQAWLDAVMAGTARIEGVCSAANVGADGLVLTNHHCVRDCVQALSSDAADYLADGFMAQTKAQERRCAGMVVQLLTSARDVTEDIDAATATVLPAAFARARDAEIARLESACAGGDVAKRCEVAALYQGGRYELLAYRRFEDVRLAFAPEAAMAHFGGDPDNFNFPRHALDFAFVRLYENGAPAATPQHLRLRFTPLEAGEIVLTAGSPGATSRDLTTAQLAFQRDTFLPWRIAALTALHQRLSAYAAQSPEQARAASDQLLSAENSLKALQGRRAALANAAAFARVSAAEDDLKARTRANAQLARLVGDPWSAIARGETAYQSFFAAYQQLEARAGGGSHLFVWARDLVRGAAERAKPEATRLPRYATARLPQIAESLRADQPVDAGVQQVLLAAWLTQLRADLGPADPRVQLVLGGESPERVAQRLAGTHLGDPAVRQRLWRGGQAAVAASTDPLIRFVRAWDAEARAVALRYQAEVDAPVARASQRVALARFRLDADTLYPDASFTPRLSYGRIEGWREPGAGDVPAFTSFGALFARATGPAPLALSPRWRAAQAALDPATQLDVATSNDIVGGNSGSPLIDRGGRVVGVVFDGNAHALGGDYFYDGALNRAVSVSAPAIRAALTQVYGMTALAAELD